MTTRSFISAATWEIPREHSLRNPPTLLAGGVGGKITMGRRIVLAGDCPTDRFFCNDPAMVANNGILVKICQAFGVQVDTFGTGTDPKYTQGALAQL